MNKYRSRYQSSFALIALTLCVGLGAARDVDAQSRIVSSQEFMSATEQQKRDALVTLVGSHANTLAPDTLKALIAAGLRDSSPRVKEAAARAVTVRAMRSVSDEFESWLQFERPVILSLRPYIVGLLADSDLNVRLEAVQAMAALEYDFSTRPAGRTLHADTGRVLVARYSLEQDGLVRSRIMQVFGSLTSERAFQREAADLLARGLAHNALPVVQQAVIGIAAQHVVALLPQVVELLSHRDPALRDSVAQSIAAFGANALPYLPRLQDAMANEPNEKARRSMQGAIAKLIRQ